MASNRFALRLAARLALLLAAVAVSGGLLAFGQAPTASLLALFAVGALAVGVWQLVNEGNATLARFVTALERGDLGQSFRGFERGAGFDQLGTAYERALDRLRGERASGAEAARLAATLVDSAPTPMLLVAADESVRFVNTAARQLFGRSEPSTIDALASFGSRFATAIRTGSPGPTQLVHLMLDGLSQRVALDVTRMDAGGGMRRIVSIKVIQSELDRAELAAQVDLVRVLTHEVMNSLTPVTSLAETASRLIGTLDPAGTPGLADAQLAVGALARRAAELERFVTTYKGFSEAPVLSRDAMPVAPWFAQLAGLFAGTPAAQGVDLAWSIADDLSPIDGDAALLTQVMLNLLKNAGEAIADLPERRIAVAAAPASDGRIKLTVADNGPGIPPGLMRDVFLPFFTTKRTGTGIGLSFARQIVMLHGGQIGVPVAGQGHVELLLPAAAQAA